MTKVSKFMLVGILAFGILYVSYFFGKSISISNQMSVFELLKDISITIFTIMGIWIAILQSDRLKKIFNIGEEVALNHSEQVWLKNLLIPILISSLILIIIIIIYVADIFLKSLILTTCLTGLFRTLSFFILVILSMLNIYAVLISMKPIVVILLNIIGSKNKLKNISSNISSKHVIKKDNHEHN